MIGGPFGRIRDTVLALAYVVTGACAHVTSVTQPVGLLRSLPVQGGDVQSSQRFGQLFCTVLAHTSQHGEWGYCDRYFRPTGPAGALPEWSNLGKYRIAVVPGIFGQCVEAQAMPFEDAIRHLRSEHHVDVEYIAVSGLGSVKYKAGQIADYLAKHWGAGQPQYIAVGYSKGASDLLEAIASDATARQAIAAVVTVAGTVLGSRLPEAVPRHLLDFARDTRLGPCDVADGGGLDSLRRPDRVDAMARFQRPDHFHAYSIAAVSDPETTSRVLSGFWSQLSVFSREQDSQVIHEDALVPGGTYLGMARADHWAVALPFRSPIRI